MGFRLRIVEGPTSLSADTVRSTEVAGADDIVDRYLRALQTAQPARTTLEFEQLETAFISVALSFAKRRGISYAAWRDVDVTPATLEAAGIRQEITTLVSPAYAQHRLVGAPAPTHLRHAMRRSRYRDFRQTSWRSSRKQLPSS